MQAMERVEVAELWDSSRINEGLGCRRVAVVVPAHCFWRAGRDWLPAPS
jgi:hypothetical protein